MFFVNVQSWSVHNACYFWIRYSVVQSRFLSTTPRISCRHIFHDFLHSHFHHCLSQHHYLTALHQPPAEMLQPGRRHLLTAPKIPVLWLQSLGPICSPDSHISTYAFWHDPLLPVSRFHHWLFDLTSGRLTVPSEPSSLVNTVIILTIDLAASSGRHTRQRHMPVDRQLRHPVHRLPPSALQPRLHGASHRL